MLTLSNNLGGPYFTMPLLQKPGTEKRLVQDKQGAKPIAWTSFMLFISLQKGSDGSKDVDIMNLNVSEDDGFKDRMPFL